MHTATAPLYKGVYLLFLVSACIILTGALGTIILRFVNASRSFVLFSFQLVIWGGLLLNFSLILVSLLLVFKPEGDVVFVRKPGGRPIPNVVYRLIGAFGFLFFLLHFIWAWVHL